MNNLEGIEALRLLVLELARRGITDRRQFRDWSKEPRQATKLNDWFAYERKEGMPPVSALISPFFHQDLPLVGLNYSPVAHNVLHAFPYGWTLPLRLSRGIVYDRKGELIALPFAKFFNDGEHPDSRVLPKGPVSASRKHDGHLGIVFSYRGDWHLTTRGDFASKSSKIGGRMLAQTARRNRWGTEAEDRPWVTRLFEIIHPNTHVHLHYRTPRLILIGAMDHQNLYDYEASDLEVLGRRIGTDVAEVETFPSVAALRRHVKDKANRNREGYVARFNDGRRVKFKFAWYIGKMVEAKLSHAYVMKRLIAGNLERMIFTLPEEVYPEALRMKRDLQYVARLRNKTDREKRAYLYSLIPPKQDTSTFRATVGKYLRHLEAAAQGA